MRRLAGQDGTVLVADMKAADQFTAPGDDTDDFWQPFTLAVGPAGHYLRTLPAGQQAAVRDACRQRLPDGPFTLPARAWYACGLVPPSGRSRPADGNPAGQPAGRHTRHPRPRCRAGRLDRTDPTPG